MLEAYGNIWDLAPDYDAIVITTNGYVKKNGEAVMGRGIALEAAQRYPGFSKKIGTFLKEFGNHVYCIGYWGGPMFFTFPVKDSWQLPAKYSLIEQSCGELLSMVGKHYNRIIMPRPGCGNGGLKWEKVKPIIEPLLDDRFTVVTFHP